MTTSGEKNKRIRLKNVLRDSEERQRLFLEHAPAALAMFDREMRYLLVSRRWRNNYGLGDLDLIGVSHYEIFPELPQEWKEAHRRGLAGEVVRSDSDRYQRADGSVQWERWEVRPWYTAEKEPGGIVIFTENITETKQAEAALLESRERIDMALKIGRSFTFEWNFTTGGLTRSDSCSVILGLSGDEATHDTGENYFRRIHPEDREGLKAIIDKLTPASDTYSTEYRITRDDGNMIVLEESARGFFNAGGALNRLVGVAKDITARKSMEEALQEYSDKLEAKVEKRTRELRKKDRLLLQQNRLAAMGEMINNIAHQWRQPLNRLGLNIQRLSLFSDMNQLDKEFIHASVTDAMKVIMHMSKTIDDFKNFFRTDKEKSLFFVKDAINQTVSLVRDSFTHNGIELITSFEGEPVISGYPNEFSQALLNIIQNAREALMEHKTANRKVVITASVKNGRSVITISDNAGGIPEDFLQKIFEPYFSTKGLHGTGIGLFMSKNIIETNMGGSITVRNTAEGAEFRIELRNAEGRELKQGQE